MTAPSIPPQVNGIDFGSASITASAFGLTGDTESVQVVGRLFGPLNQTILRGSTASLTFALSSPTRTNLILMVKSDDPASIGVPAAVTITANSSTAVVPVTGIAVGSAKVHVGAPPSIPDTVVNVTVVAPSNISLASGVSVPLGQQAPLAITLGTPAPAGGVVVTLTSSDPAIVGISPASVFIGPGAVSPATQPQVVGGNVGLAVITASAPNFLSATQNVSVTATVTLSPSPLVIPVGTTRLLAIALSASAPSSVPITPNRGSQGFVPAITMQLSSSDPTVATLQPTVQFYPDGSSITTVVVVVSGVMPGAAVIHAGAAPFIPDTTVPVVVQ
jgi:hypothetical protein